MTKICSKCKIEKPVVEFCKGKAKDGYYCWCRDCHKVYLKQYRAKKEVKAHMQKYYKENYERNKEKMKEYYSKPENKEKLQNYYKRNKQKKLKNSEKQRFSKYNLTEEDYNQMLDAQNGVCAICGKEEIVKTKTGKTRRLSIDHCHETGEIRGLLCMKCNRAIGLLHDDCELVALALIYLTFNKKDAA